MSEKMPEKAAGIRTDPPNILSTTHIPRSVAGSPPTDVGAEPDSAAPEGHQGSLTPRGPSRREQPVVRVEGFAEDIVVGLSNLLPCEIIEHTFDIKFLLRVPVRPTIKVCGTLVWYIQSVCGRRNPPGTPSADPEKLTLQYRTAPRARRSVTRRLSNL